MPSVRVVSVYASLTRGDSYSPERVCASSVICVAVPIQCQLPSVDYCSFIIHGSSGASVRERDMAVID